MLGTNSPSAAKAGQAIARHVTIATTRDTDVGIAYENLEVNKDLAISLAERHNLFAIAALIASASA